MTHNIARAIERTKNKKIGVVSATYASQISCPDGSDGTTRCAFMGSGCYAELGLTKFTTNRVNTASGRGTADAKTHIDVALAEAAEIDQLSGKRFLRIHVVGDCRDNASASIIGAAAARFTAKHGNASWSYTHSWRETDRAAWGDSISIRASCENEEQLQGAKSRGYETCLVVEEHKSAKAYIGKYGDKIQPCVNQTTLSKRTGKAMTCEECRLCWTLPKGVTIAFAAHGEKVSDVKSKLGDASS